MVERDRLQKEVRGALRESPVVALVGPRHTDAPVLSRSMTIAHEVLKLKRLYVIYPGAATYALTPEIEARSILELPEVFGRRSR